MPSKKTPAKKVVEKPKVKKEVPMASKHDLLMICKDIRSSIHNHETDKDLEIQEKKHAAQKEYDAAFAAFEKQPRIKKLNALIYRLGKACCNSKKRNRAKAYDALNALTNRIKLRGATAENVNAVEKLLDRFQSRVDPEDLYCNC